MEAEFTCSKPYPPSRVCSLISPLLSRFLRAHFDAWQLSVLEVDANLQHHSGILFGTKLHAKTERGRSVVIGEVDSAAVHLKFRKSQVQDKNGMKDMGGQPF